MTKRNAPAFCQHPRPCRRFQFPCRKRDRRRRFLPSSPIAGEDCLLKATYIGYRPQIIPCRQQNTIRLQPDTELLKEVVVTASRPLIERKDGTLTANIAGTPLSLMGSAKEMISHLPLSPAQTENLPYWAEEPLKSISTAAKSETKLNWTVCKQTKYYRLKSSLHRAYNMALR